MELGVEGKVALVMGASKGIGRGVAAALAREGAKVAIASRSQERLAAAAAEIDGASTFVADATDLERLARLPLEVAEALGSADVVREHLAGLTGLVATAIETDAASLPTLPELKTDDLKQEEEQLAGRCHRNQSRRKFPSGSLRCARN